MWNKHYGINIYVFVIQFIYDNEYTSMAQRVCYCVSENADRSTILEMRILGESVNWYIIEDICLLSVVSTLLLMCNGAYS